MVRTESQEPCYWREFYQYANEYEWNITNETEFVLAMITWIEDDNYGADCNTNGVIMMTLDLNKLSLSYSINGCDYGKAFDVENTQYRAAITVHTQDFLDDPHNIDVELVDSGYC